MERGSGSRRSSRRATGEEAAAAAGTWGDAAPAGGNQPNYPCSICRHGFTNAQALGGHMNIHRRDRAARRPTGRDAPATGTASAAYPAHPPAPAMGSSSFATYDYSGAADAAADAVSCGGAGQTEMNLFGDAAATHDHHADLRLGIGSRVPEEWGRPDGEAERSLDLELRLGRHPGW